MKALLDKQQFGPWALVTGASSGMGPEFARQIAAAGINLVLVARREALLNEVGRHITRDFGVQFRALTMDLSQEGFLPKLAEHTKDLDIGLVVSNAGTANPGEFLKLDRQLLEETLPMKPMSVEQCVSEGLNGLLENRSRIVPGRLNRIMNALVPASSARKMEADMIDKGLASKSAVASARGEA